MPEPPIVPSLFGRATTTLDGHAQLLEEVRTLRDLSSCLAAQERSTRRRPKVELDAFASHLLSHFALEESPSYFEVLTAEAPHLERRVQRLRDQHRDMTARLEELQGLADDDARLQEFAALLVALLDHFQAHERAENLLLQEFFGRDEGESGG